MSNNDWIPVKDDLPDWRKHGTKILDRGFLVLDSDGAMWVASFKEYDDCFYAWSPNDDIQIDVTHWMPLPEPPKAPPCR